MERLWRRAVCKLREKKGAGGLVWGVALLFTSVVFLVGTALISGTYVAGNTAKTDVSNAGKNALTLELDADYAQMQTGFSDPSEMTGQIHSDVLTYLQNKGYAVSGNNAVQKDSKGNIVYEIDDIQVAAVQNGGTVSGVQTALKISYSYNRPIHFANLTIPAITLSQSIYIERNPLDF